MRPRPTVGQTLYCVNVGNNARNQNQVMKPVTVVSVGRKYFKAAYPEYMKSDHMHVEYHLGTWRQRTEYLPNWALYLSPQEWEDEKEKIKLERWIGERFRSITCALTLEQLRSIWTIITGDEPRRKCHVCGLTVVPPNETVRNPSCECAIELVRLRARSRNNP